jgi:basic membrane protein A
LATLALAAIAAAAFSGIRGSGDVQATSSAPAAARLKIGYVRTAGPDSPIQRRIVAGLRQAVRRLGVAAQVREPAPREGYDPSFTAFAARSYDLVLGFSLIELDAVGRVARRFPRTRFALLDVSVRSTRPLLPANVTGVVFRDEEAGYLAGYLAGSMERRRPGRDVVSAVGGYEIPSVDRFIAGYRAGAKRAAPGIKVVYDYAESFTVPRLCASVAEDQIAEGSGVVFNVAGLCGVGALRAAGRLGAWGIGVDTDQSSLGPWILTSAVKRWDRAVFRLVEAVQRRRWRRGVDVVYGLRNGGVGLGRISRRVPRALVARVERIRRQVASGRIRVPTSLP